MSGGPSRTCPLCGGVERGEVERLAFADIWRSLAEEWGVGFSQEVVARHQPAPETVLVECRSCGLQAFDPAVPGDAQFYDELMRGTPYEETRWEFGIVAARLRPGESVVDFGCGDGAFLRGLGERSGRRVGVDHNAAALERLARSGIETHAEPFGRFADREAGGFDAACAFQLVEHLPRVADVLDPMLRSVRPGGRLFVSVPNRDRSFMWSAEPLDSPPHHLTRWAPAQLEALAETFGLKLLALERQPPTLGEARVVRAGVGDAPPRRLPAGRAARGLRTAIEHARLGPRRYRRALERGRFEQAGIFGHTMLAELEKPR